MNLINLFMHLKFCIVNVFMAPQLHQSVCVNASNTTSDAASVSSAVERYTIKNIVNVLLHKNEATICINFLSILNSFYSCLFY